MINFETLLVQHLQADADVTDLVGGHGVATELPPDAALPRLRVTLAGGSVPVRGWLYRSRVSVEAWADRKADAWALIVAASAAVEKGLDGALVEGVVVVAADLDTGLVWAPDPETQTPRYIATFSITAHPNP